MKRSDTIQVVVGFILGVIAGNLVVLALTSSNMMYGICAIIVLVACILCFVIEPKSSDDNKNNRN